jgi:hypothetical protein
MVDEMVAVMEAGTDAVEKETDLRLLAEAFPAQIKQLEGLYAASPGNRVLPLLISRLYAAYAFSVFEPRWEEGRLLQGTPQRDVAASLDRYYRRGAEFALQALELRHPTARDRMKRVAEVGPFFEGLSVEDVPALFWYGFNLGAWVNLNLQSVRSVAQAHLVRRSMERVLELQPTYYHGAAHLVLMAYFSARPPMMGGDPARASAHHESLRRIAGPDFLLADVYHARYLLVARQERQAFETELAGVLQRAGSVETYPLLNRIAVEKARIYREGADRLFE